jgi:N utilization substance protein B
VPLDSEAVEITQAVIDHRNDIDKIYEPLLTNWRFDRVSVCTKLILRLAVWELKHTDTDPRIIINEAIELAKCFAEKDAFRFINGILDKLIK